MLKFDLSDFERAAASMDALADQLPFALANALSSAAFRTKEALVSETWPHHVKVRNARFLGRALRVRKATKRALRVAIVDDLGRDFLKLHADGGMKVAHGSQLAIPEHRVADRRGGKGVPKSLRPLSLPNSFKTTGKQGGQVIYQRFGTYQPKARRPSITNTGGRNKRRTTDGRHLRLMYVLKPSAPIRADVPFESDFEHVMVREVRRLFPMSLRNAMATAGIKGRYDRQAAVGRRARSAHKNSRRVWNPGSLAG